MMEDKSHVYIKIKSENKKQGNPLFFIYPYAKRNFIIQSYNIENKKLKIIIRLEKRN